MNEYKKEVAIRWSDLDPNFHVRHSVYYDWGAWMRMCFLTEHGLTPQVMTTQQFGPILFREEALFRKEIHFGDQLEINVRIRKCTSNFARWTMVHELTKNGGVTASIITVDGAWIDTIKRRLMIPPENAVKLFELIPRTEDFEWIQK
jgi:acyl-CoA thioester hydrolase